MFNCEKSNADKIDLQNYYLLIGSSPWADKPDRSIYRNKSISYHFFETVCLTVPNKNRTDVYHIIFAIDTLHIQSV